MQRIEYVYKGPDSRELIASGNEAVIIQGDNESTEFDFRFPDNYKSYGKYIDWDFKYEVESEIPITDSKNLIVTEETGEVKTQKVKRLVRAEFPIIDGKFLVPNVVTHTLAGKLATFTVIFRGQDDKTIERSKPASVYITKAYDTSYGDEYTDIIAELLNKAVGDIKFKDVSPEDIASYLTITRVSGAESNMEMQVPYLIDGKIAERFMPEVPGLVSYTIEWDGISKEHVIPDVAEAKSSIIYVEDEAGDKIMPLVTTEKSSITISCNHAPKAGSKFLVKVVKNKGSI